jgi:hypothetical protein
MERHSQQQQPGKNLSVDTKMTAVAKVSEQGRIQRRYDPKKARQGTPPSVHVEQGAKDLASGKINPIILKFYLPA